MIARLEKHEVLPIRNQICGKVKQLLRDDRCRVGEKLPTSRELAQHFNVSLATAQTALRMLEKDGFVSCEVGRGTYVRRTLTPAEVPAVARTTIPTIGVLVVPNENHDLQQPRSDWTAGILYGIQQGLMAHGHGLHLVPFAGVREPLAAAEQRLSKLSAALAGIIAFPLEGMDQLLPVVERLGLPWVTINQYNHILTHNFVTADYYGSSVEVGKLFAQLGLQRFLFLACQGYSFSALQKENGFRDGLSLSGVPASRVEVRPCEYYLAHHGYETTARFLREAPQPPQGIYTSGDLLALGAIKACRERGLRVPEDVAVVGSTGIEAGEHSEPTLTTVELPMIEMGRAAAQMLLALIRQKDQRVPGKILPARLVRRGSTPALPAAGA